MAGHVFIINGDLNQVACDALLIPTDQAWSLEKWTNKTTTWARPPHEWNGRTMVKSVDADSDWPRVWFGNIGGHAGTPTQHFADRLTDFVDAASADLVARPCKEPQATWPKPRLAVNLLGSGRGGSIAARGELIKQILRTMEHLAVDRDIDLVLVLRGDEAFTAAQHARRQLVTEQVGGWRFRSTDTARLHTKAAELAAEARARHLVLFVGAGVSASAGLPLWRDLLGKAASHLKVDEESAKEVLAGDLRDAATLLELLTTEPHHGPASRLQEAVALQLGAYTRYAVAHGLLASLPMFEAVTTNFDTLLELAATEAGHAPAVLPLSPRVADGRWLLKLHGTVTRPESMVLNRADYLSMPRQFGALMGIVQAMLLMRHMLFVGYSLTDEDLHELLHEVRLARAGAEQGDATSFGTVLTLHRKGLLTKLWDGELELFPIVDDNEHNVPIPIAARELEMFLDLVVHLSTTDAPFLLDEDWDGLLSDNDKALRAQLHTLAALVDSGVADGALVTDFLRRFGWRSNR